MLQPPLPLTAIEPAPAAVPALLPRRWQLPGQPALDWQSFLAKKNAELQRLNGVYMNLLKNSGVEVRAAPQ